MNHPMHFCFVTGLGADLTMVAESMNGWVGLNVVSWCSTSAMETSGISRQKFVHCHREKAYTSWDKLNSCTQLRNISDLFLVLKQWRWCVKIVKRPNMSFETESLWVDLTREEFREKWRSNSYFWQHKDVHLLNIWHTNSCCSHFLRKIGVCTCTLYGVWILSEFSKSVSNLNKPSRSE